MTTFIATHRDGANEFRQRHHRRIRVSDFTRENFFRKNLREHFQQGSLQVHTTHCGIITSDIRQFDTQTNTTSTAPTQHPTHIRSETTMKAASKTKVAKKPAAKKPAAKTMKKTTIAAVSAQARKKIGPEGHQVRSPRTSAPQGGEGQSPDKGPCRRRLDDPEKSRRPGEKEETGEAHLGFTLSSSHQQEACAPHKDAPVFFWLCVRRGPLADPSLQITRKREFVRPFLPVAIFACPTSSRALRLRDARRLASLRREASRLSR